MWYNINETFIYSNLIYVKIKQDYHFSYCTKQRKQNNLVDHLQSLKTNKFSMKFDGTQFLFF